MRKFFGLISVATALKLLTMNRQWGNILTLQAAYMDPILTRFVDPDMLQALWKKTVSFIRLHGHYSSALYLDFKILQHTGKAVGFISDNDQPYVGSASSSFSSQ